MSTYIVSSPNWIVAKGLMLFIETLINRLAIINEKERATLLFCSMPESWETLITNISKDTNLMYKSMESMLLIEKSRRKTNCGSSSINSFVACSRFIERDRDGKDQD